MLRRTFGEVGVLTHIFGLFHFSVSRLKSLLVIAVCLLILITFNSQNKVSIDLKSTCIEYASLVYAQISSPILLIGDAYKSIKFMFSTLRSNSTLIEENKRLKLYISELELLVSENHKLKELLRYKDESSYNEVVVRILTNSFDVFSKTFAINVGSKQRLEPGNLLINEEGLIGKVIETTETTSKIQAITDLSSKVPAILVNSRQRCVVAGQEFSNNSLKVLYTSKELEVKDGEPVVTSGDGNLMPYGILIGFAFKNGDGIEVRTAVNWSELEFGRAIVSSLGGS